MKNVTRAANLGEALQEAARHLQVSVLGLRGAVGKVDLVSALVMELYGLHISHGSSQIPSHGEGSTPGGGPAGGGKTPPGAGAGPEGSGGGSGRGNSDAGRSGLTLVL